MSWASSGVSTMPESALERLLPARTDLLPFLGRPPALFKFGFAALQVAAAASGSSPLSRASFTRLIPRASLFWLIFDKSAASALTKRLFSTSDQCMVRMSIQPLLVDCCKKADELMLSMKFQKCRKLYLTASRLLLSALANQFCEHFASPYILSFFGSSKQAQRRVCLKSLSVAQFSSLLSNPLFARRPHGRVVHV